MVAASLHNCYRRLKRIEIPTLVVHGRRDRVVPVGNAEILADRIPGAELRILDDAGHLYSTEQPDVDEDIARFFREVGMIPDVRVADVIRRHAAQRPDAVALRQGERELTLRGPGRALEPARPGAARPRRAGGTRVAYLDRSAPEVVELLFAASKVGAVLVPLNWRMAPPELAAVMADAQAPLLIAGRDYRAVAEDVLERLPPGRVVVVAGDEYERWLAAHEPRDPGGRGEPGDVDRPDVHVRHDRGPEGRTDHAPQPRRHRADLAAAGRSTSAR